MWQQSMWLSTSKEFFTSYYQIVNEVHFSGLCITHAQFSTYEPELFPGLIYRMVLPRVVSYLQLHAMLLSVVLLPYTELIKIRFIKIKKPQILGR